MKGLQSAIVSFRIELEYKLIISLECTDHDFCLHKYRRRIIYYSISFGLRVKKSTSNGEILFTLDNKNSFSPGYACLIGHAIGYFPEPLSMEKMVLPDWLGFSNYKQFKMR